MCHARAPLRYASFASLFTGAKKAKFPYFSKGKPVSSWLILKSSDFFFFFFFFFYKSSVCTSNSWAAFCFVLSPRSSLITQRRRPTSSTCTASTRQSAEVRKRVYYVWNMDIFLTKTHGFTGGLYSPPGAVWGTVYYVCVHFSWCLLDCWTETPAECYDRA